MGWRGGVGLLLCLWLVGCVAKVPPQEEPRALLIAEAETQRVDPAWEVASVEYLFTWGGMGDGVFDWQTIRCASDTCEHGDQTPVEQETVQQLVEALVHLHPTQSSLSGILMYDNYPAWNVELTGHDGQTLLLYSTSNGDPLAAPWNLLYQGRLYAQYDGQVAQALDALFTSPAGEPGAVVIPAGFPAAEQVLFATDEALPPQLQYGFSGLLPIAEGFAYQADAATQSIHGTLGWLDRLTPIPWGESRTAHNALAAVTLLEQEEAIPCTLEAPTDETFSQRWGFRCPVEVSTPDTPYSYTLKVEIQTEAGELITTQGTLHGTWGRDPLDVPRPLPEALQRALAATGSAIRLLKAHEDIYATYTGLVERDAGPDRGILMGTLFLRGATQEEGREVPYDLMAPFVLQDGKLVRWDLSDQDLAQFLQDSLAIPLVQRLLEEESTATLALQYAAHPAQELEPIRLVNEPRHIAHELILSPCGGVPGAGTLPQAEEPLRLVTVENASRSWYLTLALVAGEVRVWDAHFPTSDLPEGLPVSLWAGPEASEPVRAARVHADHDWNGWPQLSLEVDSSVPRAERADYGALLQRLPAPVGPPEQWGTAEWYHSGGTLRMSEQGDLYLTACQ